MSLVVKKKIGSENIPLYKENLSYPNNIKDSASVDGKLVNGRYAKYVLLVLMLVSFFNFIDRQILSILAEDIKADLGLSDGDLGFLYGTAFAVFYAIFGIPLARLADSWQRKKLISIGLGFWSLMTALSGTAKGFTSLALCRFGVGVGEASATPAAYSFLYDYFSPRYRTTVLAIYNSGIYLGMGIGLFLGGMILDGWNGAYPLSSEAPFSLKGWQAAFMAVGLPGLLLAIWVATLKEPRRGLGDGVAADVAKAAKSEHPLRILKTELLPLIPLINLWVLRQVGAGSKALWLNVIFGTSFVLIAALMIDATGETLQWSALCAGLYCVFSWVQSLVCRDPVCFGLIFRCKTLCYLYIAVGLNVFTAVAIIFWSIPYYQRYHGVDASEIGSVMGLFIAVAGLIGVLLGGVLADWLRQYTRRAKLFICFGAWLLSLIAGVCLLLTDNLSIAYFCSFIFFLAGPLSAAPLVSTINDLVIPRIRAVATAVNIVATTFIGTALGPYIIGVLSDTFVAEGLESGEALRQSLLMGLAPSLVALLFLMAAIKHFIADDDSRLDRARALGESM